MSDVCPYCTSPAVFRDSAAVYGPGRDFGKLLVCSRYPACDAYVGCHPDGQPKGTLANAELRQWRKRAHASFDPLWRAKRSRQCRRSHWYAWLAQRLGLSPEKCHIGMMDVATCQRVVAACEAQQFEGA